MMQRRRFLQSLAGLGATLATLPLANAGPLVMTMDGAPASRPKSVRGSRPHQFDRLLQANGWNALSNPAPRFSLNNTVGARESLDTYRGRWLMMCFFADWCPVCAKTMPQLVELYDSLSSHLAFLAVGTQCKGNIEQYANHFGLSMSVLEDEDSETSHQFRVRAFPTTFLLDPVGRMIGSRVGSWEAEQVQPWVGEIVAK